MEKRMKRDGPEKLYFDAGDAVRAMKRENKKLEHLRPQMMLVLGSGCGDVADKVEPVVEIDYKDILEMPVSTVQGHAGKLIVGKYGEKNVLAFSGRNHCYEGNSAHQASYMVYIAHHLGAKATIMTTATGIAPMAGKLTGIENRYPANVGDLLLVESYYPNFMESSLRGPIGKVGERFNGAINVPSIFLGELARDVAKKIGYKLKGAVYVPRPGPNYETPLEVSRLAEWSRDLDMPVLGGMSVTPELEAANMLKMDSLVIAAATNQMFDMASQRAIRTGLRRSLGKNLLNDKTGKARYSLREANKMLWETVDANQPKHEEVKETAGSKDVTETLEGIIGGVVRAIKF